MAFPKAMSSRQRHKQEERGLDLYETPPEAVVALLKVEWLPHSIWEASCGRGSIVRVLRAAGHEVLATDLHNYRSPDQDVSGFDFLQQHALPHKGIRAIIQNPPYGRANDFVERSLELCPRVYMLLRLQYLEGTRRRHLLDRLARVHVFSNRLPRMHRDGWAGKVADNTQAFAWFCFNARHRGPTKLTRILWRPIDA